MYMLLGKFASTKLWSTTTAMMKRANNKAFKLGIFDCIEEARSGIC